MKIYFSGNQNANYIWQKRFNEIIRILSQAGVLVISNLQSNDDIFKSESEPAGQQNEILLKKVDGVIIEGTQPTFENGHLIALALAHQKPILYLSEKDKPIDKNLLLLRKERKITSLLKLENYTSQSLEKKILEFLQIIEQGVGKEAPNIKFTLRINSKIERYMQWKAHNSKLSKADFLRLKIEELIDQDENYQKYIGKKE